MDDAKDIRRSVKIILFNEKNEIPLLCVDDKYKSIKNPDGLESGRSRSWHLIGGGAEGNETELETAKRALFEETGIKSETVSWGKAVWRGEFELIMNGRLVRIKQSFVSARTKTDKISLENLTDEEKSHVKDIKWFSPDAIRACPDVIYPLRLADYLENLIKNGEPDAPITIELSADKKEKVDTDENI